MGEKEEEDGEDGEEEEQEKCALAIGAEEVFARTGHWSSAHTGVKHTGGNTAQLIFSPHSIDHGGTMVNPSAHSNWIHGVRIRWDGWDDLSGSNRTTPPYPHSQICVFSIKQITALLINHLSVVHCF